MVCWASQESQAEIHFGGMPRYSDAEELEDREVDKADMASTSATVPG